MEHLPETHSLDPNMGEDEDHKIDIEALEKEILEGHEDEEDDHEEDEDGFNIHHTYQEIYDPEPQAQVPLATLANMNLQLRYNPDIVIVGSGPVGLWTAIQIKILQPHMQILLIDKHETYQRSHLLRIVKSSLKQINSDKSLNEFRKLAETLTGKIRTNELEKSLWQMAEKLGIKKEFVEVRDVFELKTMFTNLKIVIGADGSHSFVRKQVFQDNLSVKKTIEYVAFVKYDVIGQAENMNLMESYAGLKLMNHLVYETTGKMVNGQSPVTLQIKINPETYKKMEGCKFKTPYNLTCDQAKIDTKLMETITMWLNMRSKFTNEKRVDGSAKVTTVNLDVYRTESVAKSLLPSQKVTVFLCGDSACGVPFFRALNNGMLCGSTLASILKECEGDMFHAIDKYNSYFNKLANKEIRRAQSIALVHKLAETAVKLNAKVPWQFISLKKLKKELLNPLPGSTSKGS